MRVPRWKLLALNPLFATVSAGLFWYTLYRYQTDPKRKQLKDPKDIEAQKKLKAMGPADKIFGFTPWFKRLTLRSSEYVNHDTKLLRFDLPDEDAVSGLAPISALLTKAWPKGSWVPVLRPYTPVSDPETDRGHIDLLVKKYPQGKMTTQLHTLKPGDTHDFLGVPLPGGYSWPPKPGKDVANIALIAGGAGITPLYQFTKAVFRDAKGENPEGLKPTIPKVTLIFGVNTPEDLLFHDEFRELERQFPENFRCVYTVSHPEKKRVGEVVTYRDFATGYVNRELLDKWMPKPDAEGGVKILLCGPPGMEEAVAGKKGVGGILGEMGYRQIQLARM